MVIKSIDSVTAYAIEFNLALNSNFFTKIDYEKGNATPFYDMNEEIKHLLNPMKVAYGENFVMECAKNKKSCQGRTKENYDNLLQYNDMKFFKNAQVYNGPDCKTIAGNNDLSLYWCENKKDFNNYNFEIFFLTINIITCLFVFLLRLVH